jgi:hypothetical protein
MKSLLLFLVSTVALAATPPKVVFIGDSLTAAWQADPSFRTNANWIGEGTSNDSLQTGSATALADFQTQVINQHPAFVHIMVGYDDALLLDSFPLYVRLADYEYNIEQMVALAKKANIKVILGNSVYLPAEGIQPQAIVNYNAWLDQYGRTNNIPVVNYSAMMSTGIAPYYPGYQTTTSPASITSPGFTIMTQMAQTAIATYGLTIKGGYLSNVAFPDANLTSDGLAGPSSQVNNVLDGTAVIFTAWATWSDGITRPMQNMNFDGMAGIWTSSNPNVMYINQQGLALSIGSGVTSISFITASGSHFSPWTMTVGMPACDDACENVSKPVVASR